MEGMTMDLGPIFEMLEKIRRHESPFIFQQHPLAVTGCDSWLLLHQSG